MEEASFRELFQSIVDRYELDPGVAAALLQKILAILKNNENDPLPMDPKYKILIETLEREDNL